MENGEPNVSAANLGPLVLIAAVPSTLMGMLLLAFSKGIPALFWYGIGVSSGGLLLLGIWIRSRRRGDRGLTHENKPGLWFPIALFTIVALQMAYLLYRRLG